MTDADPNRRRFLTVTGAVVAAGCLGTTQNGTPPNETTTHTSTTPTDAATETSTDTETTDNQQPNTTTMSTVFHFSSDPDEQDHAVANVTNLLDDDTIDLDDVALVANGIGLHLLVEDESTVPDEVRSLVDDVTFYACQNSMQALNVDETDLLHDDIEIVPAGVSKLTALQAKDGYAYIKTP